MTRLPLVFIVVLNWNGWRDTLACVESCLRLTWPNFRMVIVDNGSTDDSEDYLRRKLNDVEVIQSGSNLGFAGGNNVGIRHALNSSADYVWLLNNDAVADPGALTGLVEAMEREASVGIAGSKIYYYDEPRKIWFAGGMWEKGRLRLRHRGADMIDEGQFDEMCEVGSVSGCSMLVRSSAIRDIGLMEEGYFLYWEDVEWCARAREKGYKILFAPGSRIWHKASSSAGKSSFSQYYYSTRNGFFFLQRHDPLLLPVFAAYNMLFGLKSAACGNLQPLRGLAHGFGDFVRGKRGRNKLL
ncbi:Glycosyltransferase [Candidatus Sulfobium mesophilum]|uniref:Glycosyltransferase n=1 Tax=Candidatus Sulfobium mesophilum TaxID=2016548 RepID=A0A2U3QET2_9BACT|nr:Glycosyltransferase [Candidatus Sulfobium mesophilum]